MNRSDSHGERRTTTGTVEFFWDSGDAEKHLLVHLVPDQTGAPNAFELTGALRDAVIAGITGGTRVAIDYTVDHHEVVDPDSARTYDGLRARVTGARILPRD